MVKTTDAVSQACFKVEVQPGCTGTWYDIGGEAATVTLPKEVVTTGSQAVFNSDTHVRTHGKKEPVTATVSAVYSEVDTETFELVRDIWNNPGCSKVMCLRVTPKGGSVGDMEIYVGDHTDPGLLVGFKPPDGDAGSGSPALTEFDIFGNYIYDAKAS